MKAKKVDVVDNYHGTTVADPYRWLEDPNSEETIAWGEYQNQLSSDYLAQVASRDMAKERLTQVWNYSKFGPFSKVSGKLFFLRNDGLQNQAVLYMQDDFNSPPKVLLDPNQLSSDGTVALISYSISPDLRYMGYKLSTNGSDWSEIKIRVIETGQDLPETIKWCKFTTMAWTHDNLGFFYSRFPIPSNVSVEDQSNFNRIYYHRLGTSQEEDILIHEQPEDKELGFTPLVSEDGRYLCLAIWRGTSPKTRFYYKEVDFALEQKGDFVRLLDEEDADYEYLGNEGSIFYFKTDHLAPRGRIISIDITQPQREYWRELVKEQGDPIEFASWVNHKFVIAYTRDAYHQIIIYNSDGSFHTKLDIPGFGTILDLTGKGSHHEMFFGLTTFLSPTSIYHYSFETGKLELLHQSDIPFDSSNYETKQVFYPSKDGTRIPMFITCKKGLKLDGNNPTLLYGYGGFNVSLTPTFNPAILPWLENGGVYAIANLRGGNEYGEEWHQAGMLEKKQNVFDDFISAAEWLIAEKYTQTSRLAIMGGSNGGLLVAACMVQRPELYGAVICRVPVIDMLRYHKFTVGRYWIPEYGNAEADPEHFKFMYAYSPLHNIVDGVAYPPTLIATADTDDRVVPAHAKKFTATLQEKHGGDSPILLRLEMKAGHGAGKPTTKIIDEWADFFAFLNKELGIES